MSKFIIGLILLTLTTLPINGTSKAETATSGNLLPNAGDGHNSTSQHSSNTNLDSMGSANGFTLNGITDYTGGNYNELEAQGTGTVSASGSLVGISTTTQSGNSFTTTETSLDGGVTLNATTEIQNCEWQASSYRCGQSSAGGGQRDTFSTTIKILDANDNVLSITTLNRNNDAGYRQNTYTYTDTVTTTITGSRKWDWQWQGVDGGDPNNSGAIGPNLLGASLTATLLDITYTPISEETQEELDLTNELLEEAQLELETILEELEEVNIEQLEELQIEELALLPEFEELHIEEIKMEEVAVIFEEKFKEILVETNLVEEFQTALVEENLTEEEFFEEVGSMMEEELIEMAPPKEEEITMKPPEEKNEEIIEEKPTEEVIEEKPTNTKTEEEPNATSNENESTTEASTTEETLETNEETESTGQKDEDVSTESEVAEDTETEGSEKETDTAEAVEDETDVDVKEGKIVTKDPDISKKVEKIIKKLEAKLKRVDDKIKATSYVLAVTLQNLQPDMGSYINKRIYNNQASLVGVPNDEFFDKINILEQQQIYKDASLNAYASNDPIAVRARLLTEIESKKNQLKAEIAALRSIN